MNQKARAALRTLIQADPALALLLHRAAYGTSGRDQLEAALALTSRLAEGLLDA